MPHAIIMAGGQGERFWPMTHAGFPKYRLRLGNENSLLQKTFERLARVYPKNNIYVVTTKQHVQFIKEELPGIKSQNILIEPLRNNTAAAIYLSCQIIRNHFGDKDVVSFFPADHLIQNEVEFKKTMLGCIRLAEQEKLLVTIGIKPVFPATGYGYIQMGAAIKSFSEANMVKRFVEKPNLKKAKVYASSHQHFWNAGIFTWKLGTFFKAMDRLSPEFLKHFKIKSLSQSYKKLPNLSIDYALMEKADNIALYKTKMDWCDMGNWDIYFEKLSEKKSVNLKRGTVHFKEVSGSLLLNDTKNPLIVLGLQNIIVAQTPNGTLICPKGRAEEAALLFKKINS